MNDLNWSAVSNFINDAFMYIPDTADFDLGSDIDTLYRLLLLADDICSKHFKKF